MSICCGLISHSLFWFWLKVVAATNGNMSSMILANKELMHFFTHATRVPHVFVDLFNHPLSPAIAFCFGSFVSGIHAVLLCSSSTFWSVGLGQLWSLDSTWQISGQTGWCNRQGGSKRALIGDVDQGVWDSKPPCCFAVLRQEDWKYLEVFDAVLTSSSSFLS